MTRLLMQLLALLSIAIAERVQAEERNSVHQPPQSSQCISGLNCSDFPLHCAICVGEDPRSIRTMLIQGANLDLIDDVGLTPLHYAVITSKADMFKLLWEFGADISATDASGNSLLDYSVAIRNGYCHENDMILDIIQSQQ